MSNHDQLPTGEIQKPAVAERPESKEAPKYTLESNPEFKGFGKVEVTKTDDTKPWNPPTEVRVTMSDGSVKEEVAASTPVFTFRTAEGKILTVNIANAGHIDALHIRGEDAGSKFACTSIDELMEDMASKIPEKVATEPGVSVFAVEMGKPMGGEGLATIDELLADNVISAADVSELLLVRDEIQKLNHSGTPEERAALVARFKSEHPDSKIQLNIVRGAVIVPIVDAQKRPTTKLFMVFGPDDSGENKTLYTATPGRDMPKHPIPKQHMNQEGVIDEKTFAESSKAWLETVMLTGK